ncbi:hypothetical protein ACHHYP_10485 [Achlya hypogyna]|uniref:Uncharacterized protein n=1 Tax=Achlya hypogyna TaxID=1202772 RepID=A0A1V9YL85_ACHHY|nr:hypothetical protein ACHHYP_10485 [Achlya hypogyna]
MKPTLPGEDEADAQRQLCANVETWVSMLLGTLDELLAWKDHVVTIAALPTTALSTLAVLSSKICRCKGHIHTQLPKLLATTDDLIGGVLLNQHIHEYKTNMIEMSIAMDHEKMVLAEEQTKLRAALAQMARMKSAHRVFRWSRLSSRLRERELHRALDAQHAAFEAKREELHGIIKGQRDTIETLQRDIASLRTFAQHMPLKKPKSPPRPEPTKPRTGFRKNRVMSAPAHGVESPRRAAAAAVAPFASPAPESPAPTTSVRKWLRPPKLTSNQEPPGELSVTGPKAGICRPRTSSSVGRKKPLLLYDEVAAGRSVAVSVTGTWEARRDALRRVAQAKQVAQLKDDAARPVEVPESDDVVAVYATHANALVTRLGVKTNDKRP